MKLKLLITLLGGIFNVAIHGADPMLGNDETGEPGVEEVREVIPPLEHKTAEDERADSPFALVRSKGRGLLPIDSNRMPNKPVAVTGVNPESSPLCLDLGAGMPRTRSDYLESIDGSSAGASKAGSAGVTPKASDAAATAAGERGFPSQKPQ